MVPEINPEPILKILKSILDGFIFKPCERNFGWFLKSILPKKFRLILPPILDGS